MSVGFVRPDVADMVLRVFERSVHPELFESLRDLTIPVGRHTARIRLGCSGHLIEFRAGQSTITEVAASRLDDMPLQFRRVDRRLIGYRTHQVDTADIRYHCSYQLETVPLDIYLQLHRELEMDLEKSSLSVVLPGATLASPNCLSLLKCELMPQGLVIHSFHTYPDNAAVLRIQSLFELV